MALSLVFGKLSCPSGSSSTPTPAPTATEPPRARLDVLALVRAQGVFSARAARRTLYTWTTREQIDELLRDRVLLTRSVSPVHGPAFYDQVVSQRAGAGDALAQKLRTPGFARARFAWPVPWATILGWPGETYGDELIEVELKPTAWIAKLVTGKPGWEVVDLDDRPVPLDEALLHAERIGAVYFVHDTPAKGYARTSAGPAERAGFREYVLCNESMIASWQVGAPRLAQVIEGSAELVEALRRELPAEPAPQRPVDDWNAAVVASVWPATEVNGSLERAYEATLSFPNENYVLTVERLDALARKLRAVVVRGPSVAHRPEVAPPDLSVRPLPPAVPRPRSPRRGTF
jgi:hypothetical protein